jgi:hypothetical protein
MLANEWSSEDLEDWGLDVEFTSVDEEKEAIEDDVPEVDETKIIVEKGDVFQLGGHRLMCGDSMDKDTIEKLIE